MSARNSIPGLLVILAVLMLASILFLPACTGDEDEGGRSGGGGDDDDDDSGDDDSGDDDDDPGDCSDIRANPACMNGVTFEIETPDSEMIEIRTIFIRFDDYDPPGNIFDVLVSPGTASSPTHPSAQYREEGIADFGLNPGWTIELESLTMPIVLNLPFDDKTEDVVDLQDVVLTGIFKIDGSAVIFGSITATIPASWFAETLGSEVCDYLRDIPSMPNLCDDGMEMHAESLDGTRRDDAQW